MQILGIAILSILALMGIHDTVVNIQIENHKGTIFTTCVTLTCIAGVYALI